MSDADAQREHLDALAAEFAQRWRRGECPSISDYVQAHPELSAEIRDLFPTIAAVERLKIQRGHTRGGRASLEGVRLERLGEFRILRELGRGGMGIVYEAEQESLGRRVAIKILPRHALTDPAQLKRFQREARIVARLEHPNIVTVFGIGEHDGYHYFIMQLIKGVGLDKVVARFSQTSWGTDLAAETQTFIAAPTAGREPPQQDSAYWRNIARLGLQAANALHYAHSQGTLHCDIKPANLLVDSQGFLWVADFGVAKAIDLDKVTRTGDVTGTLQYMAPERFRGQTDARSDVYSLGMTLYELLTLRPPYSDGGREGMVHRILESAPTAPRKLNPQIPHPLETIVLKATARDPRDRYATAETLADDLRRYLENQPIEGRRVARIEQARRWCRRNPVTASLGAAVAALAALVVVLATPGHARLDRPAPRADQRPVETPLVPDVPRVVETKRPVEPQTPVADHRQVAAETPSQSRIENRPPTANPGPKASPRPEVQPVHERPADFEPLGELLGPEGERRPPRFDRPRLPPRDEAGRPRPRLEDPPPPRPEDDLLGPGPLGPEGPEGAPRPRPDGEHLQPGPRGPRPGPPGGQQQPPRPE